MPADAKPRLKVVIEEGPAHGDLYELEQTTFFRVVDTRTNEIVLAFEGEMEARLEGGMWSGHSYSGVRAVTIAPDERSVQVHYHDGREETVALPGR
ncbi:MAG TPA: hypothetical protein VIF14_16635 [Alphaproteobacteria bacterium]|jgi:hypothetical protein